MLINTGIDWTGDMFLALVAIIALIIGWIGGMLHMRENYLRLLRAERVDKRRMTRWAERREHEARVTGYVVGYREGSRAYPRGMERDDLFRRFAPPSPARGRLECRAFDRQGRTI